MLAIDSRVGPNALANRTLAPSATPAAKPPPIPTTVRVISSALGAANANSCATAFTPFYPSGTPWKSKLRGTEENSPRASLGVY